MLFWFIWFTTTLQNGAWRSCKNVNVFFCWCISHNFHNTVFLFVCIVSICLDIWNPFFWTSRIRGVFCDVKSIIVINIYYFFWSVCSYKLQCNAIKTKIELKDFLIMKDIDFYSYTMIKLALHTGRIQSNLVWDWLYCFKCFELANM